MRIGAVQPPIIDGNKCSIYQFQLFCIRVEKGQYGFAAYTKRKIHGYYTTKLDLCKEKMKNIAVFGILLYN